MNEHLAKSYGSYLLALVIFGSNGVYAHYIALSSSDIVWLRTLFGAVTLVALFFLTRHKLTFHHYPKHLLIMIISGVAMAACWLLLFRAYNLVGVGIATVLYYLGPVIIIAFSPLFFHERINLATVIGVIVVIAGALLINADEMGSKISQEGVIVAVLSAIAFAITIVANKKASHITGLENATLQLVVALAATTVFIGFTSHFQMHITPDDWPFILILGIVNTGVACFLYFWPISRLPVQAVSVCGYLEAVSAVIFSIIFLHETMTVLDIVGVVLVIGGAVFSEISRQRRTKKQLSHSDGPTTPVTKTA